MTRPLWWSRVCDDALELMAKGYGRHGRVLAADEMAVAPAYPGHGHSDHDLAGVRHRWGDGPKADRTQLLEP